MRNLRIPQVFTLIHSLLHFVEFENAVRFDIMKMGCPIFVRPINGQKLQLFELQLFIWHGKRGSNSRHSVLETDALPTELFPCLRLQRYDKFLYLQILSYKK